MIEAVLRGEIADSREFSARVRELPGFGEHSAVGVALHQAQHYVTDLDIFARDHEYHKAQTARLQELLEKL